MNDWFRNPWIRQLAELLGGNDLSEEERQFVEGWLVRLRLPENHSEAIAFLERLKMRQGTIMPNFDALYKRKSHIDRRLFGGNRP